MFFDLVVNRFTVRDCGDQIDFGFKIELGIKIELGFSSAWKLMVDIVYIRFLFADGEST